MTRHHNGSKQRSNHPPVSASPAWRIVIALLIIQSLAPGHAGSSDQIPAKPQDRPIAIVGGTIHPVTSAPVQNGTILFDGGKIVAIGSTVSVPQNAETLRVDGKHVYPGLISADTYIGLIEIGAVRASNDRAEVGGINPNVRAETAINPESELIPVARANGIVIAVVAPSGGLITGMSAAIHMDGWTWEEMTLKAPAALNVHWPDMTLPPLATGAAAAAAISRRDSTLEVLQNAFRDARAYMNAKLAEGRKDVPYHDIDQRWEAMIPVLRGEVPVVVWANEARQIQAAIAWAERENLRLIIGGGHDAWRVADRLRQKNIPVLVGGVHRLPGRRFEPYDTPFALPGRLHRSGVAFAIITATSAPHERNLPYHAATAAAYDLPREEALKAVTLYPAQIFGIDDRVGSLEVGKDATLIVTTEDPLEITSQVEMEFIQGRRIDLTSRHTMLYEKYREKYSRQKSTDRH
ncbi:MAG: amidohydrolase family protein [Bacteroidota bacterium]